MRLLSVLLLSFIISIPSVTEAQTVLGARAVGLSQAVTAVPDYEWSVFYNPALMSAEGSHASFFSIRYYGLSELSDYAIAGTHATSFGTFGVGLHTYGFDLFRESRYRIAYMNEFYNVRMGIVANMTHYAIERYGSAAGFTADLGIAYPIVEGLWLGARATNLNRGTIGEVEEELPREFSIGLSYELSDRALFVSDLVKDVQFPFSYRGAVEVTIIDILRARAGVTTEPLTYSLGIGYVSSIIRADIAMQRHEFLGWSPGIDFAVSW